MTRAREPRAHLRYYQDPAGGWRWRLVSRNGLTIDASTQPFTRKSSAKRNALLSGRRLAALALDLPQISRRA